MNSQTDKSTLIPSFQNKEIEELYRQGLHIDHEILRGILALPRETLLQDLEAALQDAISRFEYFQKKSEAENKWNEAETSFPLHAMFLLTELKATDKLPLLLGHLRQDRDFLDFWFSDHITETIWHFIYHLGSSQLEMLKSFMSEPASHYTGKWAVMSGVTQIGLHRPERKDEIIAWFESVADFFIENHDEPSLADPEVVSSLVCELCELNASDLLPKIEQLYELDLIYTGIPGTFQSVRQDIFKENKYGKRQVFENIFDHYTHITTTWYGYMTEAQYKERDDNFKREFEQKYPELKAATRPEGAVPGPQKTVKRDSPKTGRNDPCPCRSGKKYKRCCGR